jgi:hypothetical protein
VTIWLSSVIAMAPAPWAPYGSYTETDIVGRVFEELDPDAGVRDENDAVFAAAAIAGMMSASAIPVAIAPT